MEKQGQLAKNCGHSGKQIGFLRYHQTIAFFTGGFLGYFILRQSNILELGNMFETMANMMLSGIFSVNMNAFGRAPTIVWSPKSDVKICLKMSKAEMLLPCVIVRLGCAAAYASAFCPRDSSWQRVDLVHVRSTAEGLDFVQNLSWYPKSLRNFTVFYKFLHLISKNWDFSSKF